MPSNHEGSPQCQNHTSMNVHILNDVQSILLQMNRRKLLMHEQRLQWNAITLKRLQKGTKL